MMILSGKRPDTSIYSDIAPLILWRKKPKKFT